MTQAATKSSYGSGSRGGRNSGRGGEESTSTTHYAYRLFRDAEGNVDKSQGANGKDFINNLQIFENEGQYGTYLKMRVTGPIPQDDLFIAKKRDKSAS